MIEAYVAASRKSKPPSPPMRTVYGTYYSGLQALLDDASDLPALHVTYTIERRCEHVRLGKLEYILYDQHLGQSFNKLNRILVARHDGSRLAMHYACKVLAERLSTLGALKLGLLAGLLCRTFEMRSQEKGDPFDFDDASQALRLNLVAVQEIFVLAHELAHVIYPRDPATFDQSIQDRFEDFCRRRDVGGPDGHYRKIMLGREAEYFPELSADDFGARIAVRLARSAYGVPLSHCQLGVVLAFKYTRLFRHLEIIARSLAALEDETDPDVIMATFKRAGDLMWDPEERRIFFYQLREHLVRDTLTELPAEWGVPGETAPEAGDIHVSEFVHEYDERIEFPILFDLMDRLKEAVLGGAAEGLSEMANNPKRAIASIDELTGWSVGEGGRRGR